MEEKLNRERKTKGKKKFACGASSNVLFLNFVQIIDGALGSYYSMRRLRQLLLNVAMTSEHAAE